MAIIIRGKSKCSICGHVLQSVDEIAMFAAFLPPDHQLWRYSDSGMHEACLEEWQHKDEFLALYEAFETRRRAETLGRSVEHRDNPFEHSAIEGWYMCERCGQLAPKLKGVSEEDLANFDSDDAITTIKQLTKNLGISVTAAKLAVTHPRYCSAKPTATCPHCGKTLRTNTAKQCRFCHADWH